MLKRNWKENWREEIKWVFVTVGNKIRQSRCCCCCNFFLLFFFFVFRFCIGPLIHINAVCSVPFYNVRLKVFFIWKTEYSNFEIRLHLACPRRIKRLWVFFFILSSSFYLLYSFALYRCMWHWILLHMICKSVEVDL